MSKLQQINITYVPEEDRLLLRASTARDEEYRLWLTRRYAALLMQVLRKRIDQAGGIYKLASDPQTTDQLRQGATTQPYQRGEKHIFPLGEDGTLGYGIKVGDLQNGCVALQLAPKQGQGLNLNLDPSLLYLVSNLLEQAILRADWRLPLSGGETAAELH